MSLFMFIFGMMPWKINFKRVSDYGARWYGRDWEFGRLWRICGNKNCIHQYQDYAFLAYRSVR
jgi:hypothetical protein